MKLTLREARDLVHQCMTRVGHTADEADIITDHLIDCELRGLSYAGLPRALSIIERLRAASEPRRPIKVLSETASTARLDGGDQVGYLVASRTTDIAIDKARKTGLAVVGANETWYTGMFSYYLERVTGAGLVGMIAGSGGPIVAPHGGTEGRFATNPIAFGFPATPTPVIWDIGTAGVTLAEVVLKARQGEPLAEGLAFDRHGQPTTDPAAALEGRAFNVWGGHKGSGLAMVVQMLGMLAGAAAAPDGLRDCGFFMWVVDPAALGWKSEDFPRRIADYADSLRATRPLVPGQPVRVPFERSVAERERRLAHGSIEVVESVYQALKGISHVAV